MPYRSASIVVDDESIPEVVRIARGWLNVPRLAERIRRRDAGRPVLELMTNPPGPATVAN